MDKIIGIDLGTTSSRVSILNNGTPIIIENQEGDGTTPSHVAITKEGKRLVGKSAKRYALKDPSNVVFSVKRFIGRRYSDPTIDKIKKFVPYIINKSKNGDAWITLQEKMYSPEEITATTLLKLKQSAEEYIGYQVTEAVISVPAYFTELQKKATRDAANIAGLQVRRLYAEPTLAAQSYGLYRSKDEKIVVYDLGGGTFDVSVLELGDGIFEVRSTAGDMFLGGEDFDNLIVEYAANKFKQKYKIDLLNDFIAVQRLKESAELAKIILSSEYETEINLPFISFNETGSLHLEIKFSRREFESLIKPMIGRSIEICKDAIKEAEFNIEEIDQILLIGGSTRIPLVFEQLNVLFNKKPVGSIRREDAVAKGAAIQGGVLTGEVKDVLLLDVIPFSLGIEIKGEKMGTVIEKNTFIPTKKSVRLTTVTDNQKTACIKIFQGNQRLVANNLFLGMIELKNLLDVYNKSNVIEVIFDIDANGVLHVSAKDLKRDSEQRIRIEVIGGLTEQEIGNLSNALKNIEVNEVVINKSTKQQYTEVDFNQKKTKSLIRRQKKSEKGIFISYAHEDISWAQVVHKSISIAAKSKECNIWIDRMINTGEYWEETIFSAIEKSHITVLILSVDFLNSKFILNKELPRIFAEKERRNMLLFPIMARSCPFELHEDLAKFEFFNNPEEPFAGLQNWELDKELTKLTYEIAKLI